MKAIVIMFDSLNRHHLPCYGCEWTKMPNFKRLEEKTVTFDNFYVGSMPCMPARRELHTGRYNFLHRSWGPMEPFDDSMPEILKNNGVHTHLVSDHFHYWEDGGCTYHNRYSTWEAVRGQEGDCLYGQVKKPDIPECLYTRDFNNKWNQDWINRKYINSEEKMPQAITFRKGIEFIERNKDADSWFLQIETFDPHEPFYTQQRYKDLYQHDYDGPHYDWPIYGSAPDNKNALDHLRYEYAALLSMCDNYLGKVLDKMDEYNMWNDTMLIVNTDHGFLLGEKEWVGKNVPAWYNETANIPFFIFDPRCKIANQRRKSLAQTIDIAPTILEYFQLKIPKNMQGKSLKAVVENDEKVREVALFGVHGGHINITDGRYVYMRASNLRNSPLYEYTIMPTIINSLMDVKHLRSAKFGKRFNFTKDVPLMKVEPSLVFSYSYLQGNRLYDLVNDPRQENPIDDLELELKMIYLLAKEMFNCNAPNEQYRRIMITQKGLSRAQIKRQRLRKLKFETKLKKYYHVEFRGNAFEGILMILSKTSKRRLIKTKKRIKQYLDSKGIKVVTDQDVFDIIMLLMPEEATDKYKKMYEGLTRRN